MTSRSRLLLKGFRSDCIDFKDSKDWRRIESEALDIDDFLKGALSVREKEEFLAFYRNGLVDLQEEIGVPEILPFGEDRIKEAIKRIHSRLKEFNFLPLHKRWNKRA